MRCLKKSENCVKNWKLSSFSSFSIKYIFLWLTSFSYHCKTIFITYCYLLIFLINIVLLFLRNQGGGGGHPITTPVGRFSVFCHGWWEFTSSLKLLLQLIVHSLWLWQLWWRKIIIILFGYCLICYGFSIIYNNF